MQEYICAFVNSNGGTVYIGISDDGRIQGTSVDRALMDKFRLSIDQLVYCL